MTDINVIGTLLTENQPDITSVGILNFLQATGTSTFENVSSNSIQLDPGKLGINAGSLNQFTGAIAIGDFAGQASQGTNSIAIGQYAGRTNQNQNTIVLNASGNVLNTTTNSAFYVHPIRNQTGSTNFLPLLYNTTTKEILSSDNLNLGSTFSVGNSVLVVDSVNNRVGVNRASPTVSFQSTGTTNQLGTMVFSNNSVSTDTSIKGQIHLDNTNRRMTFLNNGVNRFTIYNEGWWILETVASSHPTSLNGFYGFTGNNIYLSSNNANLVFRNTSTNTDVGSFDNSGDILLSLPAVVHTTQKSNQHIGYPNTQTTGSGNSLFGSFRRTSQGWITIANGVTTYDFSYRNGTSTANALFFPDFIDNVGGILNIYLKKLNSNSTTASAIGILRVLISKRVGLTLADASTTLRSWYTGFTTNPTIGGGSTDIIRLTFSSTDTTSPNTMYMCFSLEGFV